MRAAHSYVWLITWSTTKLVVLLRAASLQSGIQPSRLMRSTTPGDAHAHQDELRNEIVGRPTRLDGTLVKGHCDASWSDREERRRRQHEEEDGSYSSSEGGCQAGFQCCQKFTCKHGATCVGAGGTNAEAACDPACHPGWETCCRMLDCLGNCTDEWKPYVEPYR
mmetsp:Transcript_83603/g.159515  ORF Transcript_83603/g.159515 Transcript_83603/m.159515 type:complete len:165 (-) Transcript_83603:161-655(-)